MNAAPLQEAPLAAQFIMPTCIAGCLQAFIDFVDNKSVGEILLKNRLAVAYDGGRKLQTDWCSMVGTRPEEDSQKLMH